MSATLHENDCRDVLPTLPEASADSVVTDPPYELGFMGKGWDKSGIAFDVSMWGAVLRVLKPGGYMLGFGGNCGIIRKRLAEAGRSQGLFAESA